MSERPSRCPTPQAGVSLHAADAIVDRVRHAVASTRTPRVLGDLGGFAGLVSAGGYRDPVLVAGTDGVGTKLLLQREAGRLRDSGIDLVAMCVNDVLTCGAEPVLFLDYIAVGRLDPERVADVVEGVADGCRAGRLRAARRRDRRAARHVRRRRPRPRGLRARHRRARRRHRRRARRGGRRGDRAGGERRALERLHARAPAARARRLGAGDAPGDLLAPTRIYATRGAALRAACDVRAMAHITGGGLPGNLPARPAGGPRRARRRAALAGARRSSTWLAGLGVERDEMRRVFNGGLGYVAVVPAGRGGGGARGLRRRRLRGVARRRDRAGEGVEYAVRALAP